MATKLKDVAQRAGVSISTASRALRDSPLARGETRDRVKAAAAELGFRPLAIYSALGTRTKRRTNELSTIRVAMIERWHWEKPPRDPEIARLLNDELSPLGYSVDWVARSELSANAARVLAARGYHVVILCWPAMDDPLLRCDWSQFVVLCYGRYGIVPFHTIRLAHNRSARETFRHVFEAGYKRIGLAPLDHQQGLNDDRERLEGLLAAHVHFTGKVPKIPPLLCRMRQWEDIQAWVRKYQPDAVIGFNSFTLEAIEAAGFQAPDDLGFAALVLNDGTQSVCGMIEPTDSIVSVIADFVDHYFKRSVFGLPVHPHDTLVPLQWREGKTLREQPAAKRHQEMSKLVQFNLNSAVERG